jgi:hypothetical protein
LGLRKFLPIYNILPILSPTAFTFYEICQRQFALQRDRVKIISLAYFPAIICSFRSEHVWDNF